MPATENFHQNRLERALQLAARLERLSADSVFAHHASGLRGALLRAVEQLEAEQAAPGLETLLERGFEILVLAARNIVTSEQENNSGCTEERVPGIHINLIP